MQLHEWQGSDYLPLRDDEIAVFMLCAMAVQAAIRPPEITDAPNDLIEFAKALAAEGGRWRLLLQERIDAGEIRRGLLAFLVSMFSLDALEAEATSGRVTQRRNGILDMLEVDFSSDDVRSAFDVFIGLLLEQSLDPKKKFAVNMGQTALKAWANFHVVGLIPGVERFVDRAGKALVGHADAWTTDIEKYAQVVVACTALSEANEASDILRVKEVISHELAELAKGTATARSEITALPAEIQDYRRVKLLAAAARAERQERIVECSLSSLPDVSPPHRPSEVRPADVPTPSMRKAFVDGFKQGIKKP